MYSIELVSLVTVVHAAATWFMVGLIWFVQVVHYPGFEGVPKPGFVEYTQVHVRRTGWVVGPPMLVELAGAIGLVVVAPSALTWLALASLAVVWASTALLQVPEHNRLNEAHDLEAIRRLVSTNWIRTAAWSLRGGLAMVFVLQLL